MMWRKAAAKSATRNDVYGHTDIRTGLKLTRGAVLVDYIKATHAVVAMILFALAVNIHSSYTFGN